MSAPLTIKNLIRPGQPTEEPTVVISVSELSEADLVAFAEAPSPKHEQKPLDRLRQRHHTLARLIATGGLTDGQACVIAGFSQARLSIIKNDPSFKELVRFYEDEHAREMRSFSAQLAGVGIEALEEIQTRLEESPEAISTQTLLDIVTKVADRTGHGPSTTSKQEVNVTVGLADRLKAARQKAMEASLIDVTPKTVNE